MQLPLRYRRWLLCCLVLLVPGLAYPAYSVRSAPDWPYRVFHADIVRVSAPALEAQGRLGISQELVDGEGTILRQNSAGSLETALHGLSKPDGLWISEDSTHMARLLLDPRGQLQVIGQHLRCAQAPIALAPGRYLPAEQGRKRILELKRRPHGI